MAILSRIGCIGGVAVARSRVCVRRFRVSSTDFRHITIRSEARKAEKLFRAAVSAFCAITRPSRREITQLEDLTLPLFDEVTVESKRYVAAALSECPNPPAALVRRLADESVDIAAPLLVRSTLLTDVDLIALIGRHGHGHARAIGRRPGLNPSIARLVGAIESKVVVLRPKDPATASGRVDAQPASLPIAPQLDEHIPGAAAENARRHLRAAMRPASTLRAAPSRRTAYDRLRETVLTGNAAFFQTALADALETDFDAVREVSDDPSYAWLLDALRVLDIGDEQAFLVTAALYPSRFGDLQSIRLFLMRYAAIGREDALQRIARWKLDRASQAATPAASGSDAASTIRFAG
jgi:uncharacterized protein (DUF2336 family)